MAIGLYASTIGIISSVGVGLAMINWALFRGYLTRDDLEEMDALKLRLARMGLVHGDEQESGCNLTTQGDSIDAASFHLAVMAFATMLGYGIHWLTILMNRSFHFPVLQLFLCCMAGGILVQLSLEVLERRELISRIIDAGMVQRLQGIAVRPLPESPIERCADRTPPRCTPPSSTTNSFPQLPY